MRKSCSKADFKVPCVSILNFRGVNPSKAERLELSFVLVWSFRFANALIANTHSDSTPGSKLV